MTALVQCSAGVILTRIPARRIRAEAVHGHRSLSQRVATLLATDHIQRGLQQPLRLRSAIGGGAPASSQQLLTHQWQLLATDRRLKRQTGGSHIPIPHDGQTGAQQGNVIAQLAIGLAELLMEDQGIQIVAASEERLVGVGQIMLPHHNAQQKGLVGLRTDKTVGGREQIMMMNCTRKGETFI